MKMFFILILISLISSSNIFSQEKSVDNKKSNDPISYTIKSKFPVNVQHVYSYTDSTKITRIFSDSTKQEFQRVMKYYFTLRAPNVTDKDGFTIVIVSVDSLEYWFKNKDTSFYYNSQADDMRPPKSNDYTLNLVPLGLDFEMTYSPYQEVAKVWSENLENKRKYVTDTKTAPTDADVRFNWTDRLSDTPLLSCFDVVKGILPNMKTYMDSTWNDEIVLDIEGATIKDSVQFKLSSFNIKNYIIDGTVKSINPVNKKTRLFDIGALAEVVSTNGKGDYKIKVQPKGTISELLINHELDIKYQIQNDFLTQKISTNKHWKLEGMFRW
jgi:hypothetical protein